MIDRSQDFRELLIGCGIDHDDKALGPGDEVPPRWHNVTTLDILPETGCDWVCDLNAVPWRYYERLGQSMILHDIESNSFDEIHAYEVLEHLGQLGDARAFFAHFGEIYRILKPDGCLYATVPSRHSRWQWGDPSHTRSISKESLIFLDQSEIDKNRRARTQMSYFGHLWKGDFKVCAADDNTEKLIFCLQAKKPVREFHQ